MYIKRGNSIAVDGFTHFKLISSLNSSSTISSDAVQIYFKFAMIGNLTIGCMKGMSRLREVKYLLYQLLQLIMSITQSTQLFRVSYSLILED